jgi:polysaccharide biosynthesis/export protein
MPLRTRIQYSAGLAAFVGLCAGVVGCSTASVQTVGYPGRTASVARPAVTAVRAAPADGPGTVIATSVPVAPQARPAAPKPAVGDAASVWQPVQRVTANKPAAPPTGGIARVSDPPSTGAPAHVSIDLPAAQPIAVAGLAPPGEPPAHPDQPRLEPQPVLVAPPAAVIGPPHPDVPREFAKRPLPPYVVEPPDILLVSLPKALSLPDQPVEGQHLVRPDGTISLGIYGDVYVAGLSLTEARDAIAAQLHVRITEKSIEDIKKDLVVDVLAYNSKVYYVITDGGGYGEQVYPIPITGNETVLDALSKINGLPPVASKKRIWVARATLDCDNPQILPVDWCGITQRGCAVTNYQIMPNDRVYVAADKWIVTDSWLSKRLNPIDRVMGSVLLGSSTVNSIRTNGKTSNTGGGLP